MYAFRIKSILRLISNIILRLAIIGILIYLGIYLNKLFEALLVLVAWFQFELASEQFWLYKELGNPSFSLLLTGGDPYYLLYIQNVSPFPAYAVKLSRILDKNFNPISPALWEKEVKTFLISCLTKEIKPEAYQMQVLAMISKDFYEKYLANLKGSIEIGYLNSFRELKFFFCYFTEDHKVIPVIERRETIGFLLALPYYFWLLKNAVLLKKAKI
jgi:hypothetical protein